MTKKSPREYHLLRSYGLSLAEYNRILKSQNNACFICQRDQKHFKTNLAVDHNHQSKEIHGLLCNWCNRRFIGRNRDWKMYERASEYLKKGLGLFCPPCKKRPRKQPKRKS